MSQDISEKMRAEEATRVHMQELETALKSTIEVATTLSEMRDPYASGHERRVAHMATAIGAELGLDAHRLERLRVAGHLHDIGKMTIPVEILTKPGKISKLEYQLIQGHAQASGLSREDGAQRRFAIEALITSQKNRALTLPRKTFVDIVRPASKHE